MQNAFGGRAPPAPSGGAYSEKEGNKGGRKGKEGEEERGKGRKTRGKSKEGEMEEEGSWEGNWKEWSTRHMVNSSHSQVVTVNLSHGQVVTQSTQPPGQQLCNSLGKCYVYYILIPISISISMPFFSN